MSMFLRELLVKKDDDFKRFGLPRNDELACVEDDKVMRHQGRARYR